MITQIESKIDALIHKGVKVIDPRQVYLAEDVDLDRIFAGCVLYPGTRISGSRTLIGTGAKIGTEGYTTLCDAVIGSSVEVASGFITGATLLPGAVAGANCHFRVGTLLEENAFTGHCVGLKQTILMYSVGMGSLINFCDALMSGGRSRKEHSEIGSGFIHFNFTPFGEYGDKATPSLVGNVVDGVFLDQDRIFLGGMSGMVGPNSVGFGAMTVAGQVVRGSVPAATMHSEIGGTFDKVFSPSDIKFSKKRLAGIRQKNIEFIGELYALKQWYLNVRLKRSRLQEDTELSLVLNGAIETITACIKERIKRYNSFATEWAQPLIEEMAFGDKLMDLNFDCNWNTKLNHDEWVRNLSKNEKSDFRCWLNECKNTIAI